MEPKSGRVHVAIFRGRWEFLPVPLSYINREPRQNDGAVDRVLFVMIRFTNEALGKLHNFSVVANSNSTTKPYIPIYTERLTDTRR